MSTTERDEVAALLPPPPTERDVPAAAAHRAGLLRELARPPAARFRLLAPALAAAAVVLVVALTAAIGLSVGRRSGGEVAAPPGPAPSSVPPSSVPASSVPPSSVRGFDFRNDAWELPLDLRGRPQVSAATAAGGPVASFTDGVARLPKNDRWPLQFSITQPVAYLRPTPKQVGAADGPVPESAIVVVEIRPTDPADRRLAYTAVIAFAGLPGALFPGPQTLIALVSGPLPPVVTVRGDTVTIGGGKMPPQRYVRQGTTFVRTT